MKITYTILLIALLIFFAACDTADEQTPGETSGASEPVEELAEEEAPPEKEEPAPIDEASEGAILAEEVATAPVAEDAQAESEVEQAELEEEEEPAAQQDEAEETGVDEDQPEDNNVAEDSAVPDETGEEEDKSQEEATLTEETSAEDGAESAGSEGSMASGAAVEPQEPVDEVPVAPPFNPWLIPDYTAMIFGMPHCAENPPAGMMPPVALGTVGGGEFGVICLYGFETNERIDVELFDPSGSLAGSAAFIITIDGNGQTQIQRIAPDPGATPLYIDAQMTDPLLTTIGIWLPPSVPNGEWTIRAASSIRAAEGTLMVLEDRQGLFDERVPRISTAPSPEINPFQSYFCADYKPGEPVYIQGLEVSPQQPFYVAIYQQRSNGTARLVEKIPLTSDEQGRFETVIAADGFGQDPAQFVVMSSELGQGTASVRLPWYGCYGVSTTARETPEPTPTAEPTITPTPEMIMLVAYDCLPYDPQQLRIEDEGDYGWLLTDGRSRMLMLDNEADARDALALAQQHTAHCFIGRGNSRADRSSYIMQFWTGDSGIASTISQVDCIPFDAGSLQIIDEGAAGWLLTDGRSRMKMLDNEADAQQALQVAQSYSQQCFIGRGNNRSNRIDYIVPYWK